MQRVRVTPVPATSSSRLRMPVGDEVNESDALRCSCGGKRLDRAPNWIRGGYLIGSSASRPLPCARCRISVNQDCEDRGLNRAGTAVEWWSGEAKGSPSSARRK